MNSLRDGAKVPAFLGAGVANDRAHVRLTRGRPPCTMVVRHLPLYDRRVQWSLVGVVGDRHAARMVEVKPDLFARSADIGLLLPFPGRGHARCVLARSQ